MRCATYACLLAVFFLACASSQETAGTRRSANLITAEEIAASSARNALDAVQLLRPNWLRMRGVSGSTLGGETIAPVVYSDNIRLGDAENLLGLPASDIASIEYLNSRDATTRFGTGHTGGAILIKTK
jgi:hypothetical protein